MKLNETISRRILELLEEKKLTAYGLYTRSGVSQSTISTLKNMGNEGVNVRILFELCEGFGIGLDEFFDSPLFVKGNIID